MKSIISYRVLLIEDDEDDYILIRKLLSEVPTARFHLEWARTYDEALLQMCSGRFDVYLLDYHIGEQTGVDLMVEAMKQGCKGPVILLTGLGNYDIDMEAMQAGATDYLVKGQFNGPMLERSIRYAIGRKRSEEKLQFERDKLRDILGALPDAVCIINRDYDIEYVNPVFEKELGPGMGAPKCYTHFRSRPDACDWCSNQEIFEGRTRRREWHRTSTGKVYDILAIPLCDSDGTVSKLTLFHDITTYKETQKSLQEAQKSLEAVVETAAALILLCDPEGKVVLFNRACEDLTGYKRDEVIGRTIAELFLPPELVPAVAGQFANPYALVASPPSACPWITKSGEKKIIEWRYAVIPSPTYGEPLLLGTGIDITDRKKAENALLDSERQCRFLASKLLTVQESERALLARQLHDSIGQTLAAIKFTIEHSLDEPGNGAVESIIPMIQGAIEEVRGIYMGLRPTVLDDFGIVAAIGWMSRELAQSLPTVIIEKQISIQEDEIPDPLKVVIFRVAQEALVNMREHSRASAAHVSLRKTGTGIELAIRDNGLGFEVEKVLASEDSARGLGLASMIRRTQISGGTLDIQSDPQAGTTVRATWPAPPRPTGS